MAQSVERKNAYEQWWYATAPFEHPGGSKPQPEVLEELLPHTGQFVKTPFRKVAPIRERCGVVYGAKAKVYEHRWYAAESVQVSWRLETAAGNAGKASTAGWPVRQYAFSEGEADARTLWRGLWSENRCLRTLMVCGGVGSSTLGALNHIRMC